MKSPKSAILGSKSRFLKIFTKVINEDPGNRTISRRQLSALSPTKPHFPNVSEVEDEGFFTVEDLTSRIGK